MQRGKSTINWNCDAVQIFTLFKLTFCYFIKANGNSIKRKIDTEKLNWFDDYTCQNSYSKYYTASVDSIETTANHHPDGAV